VTPQEKAARAELICRTYVEGTTKLDDLRRKLNLGIGRMRIMQILKAGGVWKPYVKSGRDKFLGVTVTEETKTALERKAADAGKSVSRLASEVLDEAVKTNEVQGAAE
jgi:hypothetical protein